MIKVAKLTAAEGEYNKVGTELDGMAFSVQIPGFGSSNMSGKFYFPKPFHN